MRWAVAGSLSCGLVLAACVYPQETTVQGGVKGGSYFQLRNLGPNPWQTDILRVANNHVIISGGPREGLKVGDILQVEQPGETVISRRSGLPITLPGQPVAQIRVASFFGQGNAEGAVTVVTSGVVRAELAPVLIVTELHQ
jgi:hypothetical protein